MEDEEDEGGEGGCKAAAAAAAAAAAHLLMPAQFLVIQAPVKQSTLGLELCAVKNP